MIPLGLSEVAELLGATLVGATDPALRPGGVARIDSRDVEPGDVFACVVGENVDGHDFVAQALERGAVLSLAARPVEGPHVVVPDVAAALALMARAAIDRRPGVAVVGITGSSGKTSTKDLLAQVLESVAPTVSPPGSFNNELGLPMTVLRATDSTRYLVLELGARGGGHIRALCDVAPPQVGVVVNVGSAHIGEFGDRAAIARAKGELIEALPADGVAVLNADDALVAAMAALTPARVITFGVKPGADVHAVDVELDEAGRASFVLDTAGGVAPVSLQVVGAHQVSNALAAAAAALALDVPLAAVAVALSDAKPRSRWRMEVVTARSGATIVNDAYNANPESVLAAFEALVAISRGRRTWAVVGEMRELGEGARAAHEDVGRAAVVLGVDRLVVVGDEASGVLAGALGAGADPATVSSVRSADEATALLRGMIGPSDVVLVKASRAIGLERVASALADDAGEGNA